MVGGARSKAPVRPCAARRPWPTTRIAPASCCTAASTPRATRSATPGNSAGTRGAASPGVERVIDGSTLAFVGVALAVAVVPGPDMALVTRNTLLGGRRIGAATVGGIGAGLLVWGALAA